MRQNNKEKRFSDYIKEINSDAEKLLESEDIDVKMKAVEIGKNADELGKALKGIQTFLLVISALTLALLALALIFGIAYFAEKKSELSKIEQAILYPNNESTLTYGERDGKVLTYKMLSKENEELSDSLNRIKFKLDFATETFKIKFNSRKIGDETNWTMTSDVLDEYKTELKAEKDAAKVQTDAIKEANEILKKKGY